MTLYRRTRKTLDVQKGNGVKSVARTGKTRVMYIVVVLTFAYVTSYFGYYVYVIYNMITPPDISFKIVVHTKSSSILQIL